MYSSLYPTRPSSKAKKKRLTMLQGRFLGLRPKKGKPKWMRLKTDQGKVKIKLPKSMRGWIAKELEKDMPVQVWAKSKKDTYKAVQVIPNSVKNAIASPPLPPEPKSHTIKVCMKGSCRKRGSGEVCRALESARDSHPEASSIRIEKTGCLKCCKKGPNICILPEKKLLHKVESEQAAEILSSC